MDFLFDDDPELLLKLQSLTAFKTPTNRQIVDWLKQTKGILSKEMKTFLHLPIRSTDTNTYTGPLTVSQQVWIYQTINE